jgi:hypothetical protein
MRYGLLRKYTTLSLGYGIVRVPEFQTIPESLTAIPTKLPFEL